MARRKKRTNWTKPTAGHTRYTGYVRSNLLTDFKGVCEKEALTITEGLNQALENWTYYETETDTKTDTTPEGPRILPDER